MTQAYAFRRRCCSHSSRRRSARDINGWGACGGVAVAKWRRVRGEQTHKQQRRPGFRVTFTHRLSTLRRERGLTQPALADRINIHVSQLRRYEAGTSQPTLDVLRRLATELAISADVLLFDPEERTIPDDLRHHLEAINQLDPDERNAIRTLVEGTLLRHQARKLAAS